jgi:hypothetical protein
MNKNINKLPAGQDKRGEKLIRELETRIQRNESKGIPIEQIIREIYGE